MSEQLNYWIQQTGDDHFERFLTVLDEKNEEKLRKHAATIYRNYEQNRNEKYFMYNKIGSSAVVLGSCALILLSRYFYLRERVQTPLEYMALAAIVIFGAGFLYSLYQEHEYKVSGKSEEYSLDYKKHAELPEIQTIMDELKAEKLALSQTPSQKSV